MNDIMGGLVEESENEYLHETKAWSGRYRDVGFRIICNQIREEWFYYLFIREDRLKPKLLADFKKIDHIFDVPVDMHGSCTYFSKRLYFANKTGTEKDYIIYKIGCDYIHLWDIGEIYTFKRVFADCKKSIDHFHELNNLARSLK